MKKLLVNSGIFVVLFAAVACGERHIDQTRRDGLYEKMTGRKRKTAKEREFKKVASFVDLERIDPAFQGQDVSSAMPAFRLQFYSSERDGESFAGAFYVTPTGELKRLKNDAVIGTAKCLDAKAEVSRCRRLQMQLDLPVISAGEVPREVLRRIEIKWAVGISYELHGRFEQSDETLWGRGQVEDLEFEFGGQTFRTRSLSVFPLQKGGVFSNPVRVLDEMADLEGSQRRLLLQLPIPTVAPDKSAVMGLDSSAISFGGAKIFSSGAVDTLVKIGYLKLGREKSNGSLQLRLKPLPAVELP